jgi:hypothetical protein
LKTKNSSRQRCAKDNHDKASIRLVENKEPSLKSGLDEWHFALADKVLGPFTLQEICEKINENEIDKNTLVWCAGQVEWRPASQVPGLFLPPAIIINTEASIGFKPPPQPSPELFKATETPAVNLRGAEKGVSSHEKISAIRARTSFTERVNFVRAFWRGEYSLAVSYWLFGFFGNLVIASFALLLNSTLSSSKNGYYPKTILVSTVATLLVTSLVVVWQNVGVWRSANRAISMNMAIGKRSGWPLVAKAAVVLSLIQLLAEMFFSTRPQLLEVWDMAFNGDPSIPPYSIRLMRDGTEAEITGGFKYGLAEDLERILKASPRIKVLHLDSLGGRIGEAEKVYTIVRMNRLDTYVANKCASACTVAFVGGKRRFLERGAILGFHAGNFPGVAADDLASLNETQTRILGEAGVDKAFIKKASETPSKQLWQPDENELKNARVFTHIATGDEFASSGLGGNLTKERLVQKLRKNDLLDKWSRAEPREFDTFAASYLQHYEAGSSQNELNSLLRSRVEKLVSSKRAEADDDVVVDIGSLILDQYAFLSKSARECYLYASGTGSSKEISPFPAELVARDVDLQKRIIETARQRADIPKETAVALWKKVLENLRDHVGSDKTTLLFGSRSPEREADFADYCSVEADFIRSILDLGGRDAVALLRQLFSFMRDAEETGPKSVDASKPKGSELAALKEALQATRSFALKGDMYWVVLDIRQSLEEAVAQARYFGLGGNRITSVMKSENGTYSVVTKPERVKSEAETKLRQQKIFPVPKDILLSKGAEFTEEAWAPAKPIPIVSGLLGEKLTTTIKRGRIVVELTGVPSGDDKEQVTRVSLRVNGQLAISDQFSGGIGTKPNGSALILRLDPKTTESQVIFTHYTGGAHCCTEVKMAYRSGGENWAMLDLGLYDADGPAFADIDRDGVAEIISTDNSFLYAFAPYASSLAPTKIKKFIGGRLLDVTREPAFQEYLRQNLLMDELNASPERWNDNGFLAGWVAEKTLLGEGQDAWNRMLGLYDRASQWVYKACAVPLPLGQCSENQQRATDFPTALRAHLLEHGYMVPGITD